MKVLLATDDGVSRTLLQRTLERSGMEVECVTDGESAAQSLTAPDGPRIAILDWVMPARDGLSVCRSVRACTTGPYVYLILLTSRESSADIVSGFESGADDYLTKPFTPSELKARLRVGERCLHLQDSLLHGAEHDPLTNLPNRSYFVKRLAETAHRTTAEPGYQFSLLFVDIDRFKFINDSLGHVVGDELMRGIAHRLLHAVRREATPPAAQHYRRKSTPKGDFVARIGGDEFIILLDNFADVQDGVRVAKRVGTALQAPFVVDGKQIFITASIGISASKGSAIDPSEILRGADAAMYRAKSTGKACYVVDDATGNAAAVGTLRMESDLRTAMQNNEFEIYYQPIVKLSDRRIVSFEALLRWNHPTLGMIPPAAFIPLAENTGLILPLGAWVLKQACRQVQQWNSKLVGDDRVSVCINISPLQFREGLLVKTVRDVLVDSGLEARFIELEVTENLTMQDAGWATHVLRDLKHLGVSISLDDFGTGYSSLSYLRHLPIRTLKIDRSFISEIDVCREGSTVVETIVDLGHNLGMTVVAEGIETVAQLAFLETARCDFGQGYLFSRPVDAAAATKMLTTDRTPGPALHEKPSPHCVDSSGAKWVF